MTVGNPLSDPFMETFENTMWDNMKLVLVGYTLGAQHRAWQRITGQVRNHVGNCLERHMDSHLAERA